MDKKLKMSKKESKLKKTTKMASAPEAPVYVEEKKKPQDFYSQIFPNDDSTDSEEDVEPMEEEEEEEEEQIDEQDPSGAEEESDNADEAESEDEQKSDDEPESEDSDESESEEEEGQKRTVLRKQLKDLSFEELEALKQKMGLKEYNEAMFGVGTSKKKSSAQNKRKKFKRTNKNRPREMSSKVRVPKLREVVKVPKKVRKDPRFDDAYGNYNAEFWNAEYGFLRDIQKKEADNLKKNLKSVNDSGKKKEIKRFIQKVSDKEKAIAVKEKETQKRNQEYEENQKRIQEGKRPFYMKKTTRKLVELVEKYDELKASGRLEKYLKKKRKKNAVRDRKQLKSIK